MLLITKLRITLGWFIFKRYFNFSCVHCGWGRESLELRSADTDMNTSTFVKNLKSKIIECNLCVSIVPVSHRHVSNTGHIFRYKCRCHKLVKGDKSLLELRTVVQSLAFRERKCRIFKVVAWNLKTWVGACVPHPDLNLGREETRGSFHVVKFIH